MTKNKKTILIFLLCLIPFVVSAQGRVYCFWVPFTDKNNNGYSISYPETYLSQKALNRRINLNIPVDFSDLPVTKSYTDSLKKEGFFLQNTLKWLNGAIVYSYDSSLINITEKYDFIERPILIGMFDPTLKSSKNKFREEIKGDDFFESNFAQVKLENGFFLHHKGFRGKDKTIAIIDAGFHNADFLPAFDSVWYRHQVIGTKDFSTFPGNVFNQDQHGMNVFSIIAGNISGQLIGTAPDVSLWLLRSEVVDYEQPIEEYNWVAAAEFADSAGVDIINTSLGYSSFDGPFTSYTYNDMDGKTAIISKASAIAAKKGILLVTSAGNEGNMPWKYITAPADAEGILAIGATDHSGLRAGFSSLGYSFDGRVKPEIMAMGQNVIIQDESGILRTGSGTSFSSPVVSGLAACLWQAFPEVNNVGIREAIIESSSFYENPDSIYGYGIPDFEKAYLFLEQIINKNSICSQVVNSVFTGIVQVNVFSDISTSCRVFIYGLQGSLLFEYNYPIFNVLSELNIDLTFLPKGIYLLSLQLSGKTENHKIVKFQ